MTEARVRSALKLVLASIPEQDRRSLGRWEAELTTLPAGVLAETRLLLWERGHVITFGEERCAALSDDALAELAAHELAHVLCKRGGVRLSDESAAHDQARAWGFAPRTLLREIGGAP